MRIFLSTLTLTLLLATSANATTLDLTTFGSGNQVGQQQGLTAKLTNSSNASLTARVCLLYNSYKKYLTLETNVAGSQPANCLNIDNLAVGSSSSIRWSLLGQERTTKTLPKYQVTVSVAGQVVTSAEAPFQVNPIPAALRLSPVAPTTTNSLRSLTLGDLVNVTYSATNQGGAAANNWWTCLTASNFLTAVRTSSYSAATPRCHGGSVLYSGRSESHTFTIMPVHPGSGHIYLDGGIGTNYRNRVARLRLPFSVASWNAFMLATPMRKQGANRVRVLSVKNNGKSSPSVRACVSVRRGNLVSLAGQGQSCYLIGPIRRGRTAKLPIVVRGNKAAATVTLSVPDTKAKKIKRTFDFAS